MEEMMPKINKDIKDRKTAGCKCLTCKFSRIFLTSKPDKLLPVGKALILCIEQKHEACNTGTKAKGNTGTKAKVHCTWYKKGDKLIVDYYID
jgi:hypothetical protein